MKKILPINRRKALNSSRCLTQNTVQLKNYMIMKLRNDNSRRRCLLKNGKLFTYSKTYHFTLFYKNKAKVYHRTGHEGTDRE
jgi:hypothetical protein